MNAKNAAMLALSCLVLAPPTTASAQGWYLMAPPFEANGEPDVKRSIADWEIVYSFDTARACEWGRMQLLGYMERTTNADLEAAGQQPATAVIIEDRVRASRCISVEDGRLPKR